MFNYNILKINKIRLLLINKYKLSIIICIIRDNQKMFLINKKRVSIIKNKINKNIKE